MSGTVGATEASNADVDVGRGPGEASAGGEDSGETAMTRKHIRGSSLLLVGRGISVGGKFLAQLLIVRYLSTTDYGAWTYALTAVAFFQAALGLNRAIPRFLPQFLEEEDYGRFFGTIGVVFTGLMCAGALIVGGFYAFPEAVSSLVGEPDASLRLLFIVIFLVPLEALDNLLTTVCAVFARARTLFIRRYVIHPGLRLAVAVALVVMEADVELLAFGYLASTALGVAYYLWVVADVMREEGLLAQWDRKTFTAPVREVVSYTAPVMMADWLSTTLSTAGPLFLGYFADMDQVALFRVVVPMATLNLLVRDCFTILYQPAASRLYARDDPSGLSALYWRTAAWVAVLSFPAFALTMVAGEPLTVLAFGERYRESGTILSLLSFGFFFQAVLGLNGITLKVTAQLRWILGASMIAVVVSLLLNLLLVPLLGALGAAVALTASLVVFSLLKHVALRWSTGVRLFDRSYTATYVRVAAATGLLVLIRLAGIQAWSIVIPAALVASAVVLVQARRSLGIEETFPELLRFAPVRLVLKWTG